MSITKTNRTFLLLLSLILIVTGFLLLPEKANALTYNSGGVTWTYIVNEDGTTCSIGDGINAAVDSSTSGSLTIPSTINGKKITKINNNAFENRQSIYSLTIPTTVKYIGDDAFSGCTKLATISIPSSVESIGEEAFYYCDIASISIPSSVKTIGDNAFKYCKKLSSVTLQNGLETIGEGAFSSISTITSITIPDSVTSIGANAFGNSKISSINIPENVAYIGDKAFGITTLASITVNENNTHYKSVNNVLFTKDGTQLVTYPALQQGSSYTIPDGVITVSDYAFGGNKNLTTLIMPDSITNTGRYVFTNCTSLSSIKLSDNLSGISYTMFDNCTSLSSITIPNKTTTIDNYAFNNCTSLNNVVVPDSVTSINFSAFNKCSALSNITLSNNITNISNSTFVGCTSLTDIIIPEGVTIIEANAFSGCSGLVNVSIPNTVVEIESSAFANCRKLAQITIPNSVRTLGAYAFNVCSVLKDVTANQVTVVSTNTFTSTPATKTLHTYENSPSSMTMASYFSNIEYDQEYCSEPVLAVQPVASQVPCGDAYELSVGMAGDTDELTYQWYKDDVVIQNATSSTYLISHMMDSDVGNYYCVISNTDEIVDTSITVEMTIKASTVHTETVDGIEWKYKYKNDGTVSTGTGTSSNTAILNTISGAITIPSELGECPVSEIGDCSFYRCAINEVVIPSTVTQIGVAAFRGCTSLGNNGTVVIPNSITSIGNYAFSECTYGLKSIVIPDSVTSMGTYTFYYSSNLNDVTLSNGLTKLPECMFYNCFALANINIPANVTSFDAGVFKECNKLNKVVIPNNVTKIGINCFYGCDALDEITANNLRIIGSGAFSGIKGTVNSRILHTYEGSISSTALKSYFGIVLYDQADPTLAPVITVNPVSKNIAIGGNNSISVIASDGTAPLTYQWYKNGNIIDGATENHYDFTNASLEDAAQYHCVVTDGKGATATSSIATIAIYEPLAIMNQPASQSVSIGETTTLSVSTTGGAAPYTYQWYKGQNRMNEETSRELTFSSITNDNLGEYHCVVSDATGDSVTSNTAILTLSVLPEITVNPTSQSVNAGDDIYLVVAATGGTGQLFYRWYKDDTLITTSTPVMQTAISTPKMEVKYLSIKRSEPMFRFVDNTPEPIIEGADTSTLIIRNINTDYAGSYYCVITDEAGNVVSTQKAIVTVITEPIPSSNPHEITSANDGKSNNTIIVGTIYPLQIKAVVPTVITFHIDPNEVANYTSVPGGALTAPSFNLQNACNAPLSFGLNSISPQEGNPAVVSESKFTDTEWQNLTVTETTNNIAFGIVGDDQTQWQTIDNLDAWYELARVLFGSLQGHTSADLHLKSKYGLAWGNATEQTITYDVVYIVALAE